MTFNSEKSNYQILNFSKQQAEEIKESVKKGNITRTKTYKYLGDIINVCMCVCRFTSFITTII